MKYSLILKTQKPLFRAAFAYVMPSGTVLVPTGNGTGSWRHNRVARVGTVPATASNPKVLSALFFPLRRRGPVWVGFGMIEGFWASPDKQTGGAVLY